MPNAGNSSVDADKNIAPLNTSTLAQIASFKGLLDLAASAAGVSSLSVAAPISREINKVEVGDYNDYGVANLLTAAKNSGRVIWLYPFYGHEANGTTIPRIT